MRQSWNFCTAGQLTFGPGAVSQLGDICRRRQWSRVLVVADPVLSAAGLVERVCGPLMRKYGYGDEPEWKAKTG